MAPWGTAPLQKTILIELVKKFQALYGTEGSLPYGQEHTTGSYPGFDLKTTSLHPLLSQEVVLF
jgi:hypothetical protein